ncbi:uncharacterized protein LOC128963336 [Oppia nitens]|uniref:uncharacterized protein LOC128963336 n=1 Tax=Oppia nitens TaxID=1686743 RepID=UPI0023D9DD6A|nr:uncharacterized protein LOC128963336 [Oppia nitens]
MKLSVTNIIFVTILLLLIANQIDGQRRRSRTKNKSKGRSKSDLCHQKEAEKCMNKMVDMGKGKDPTAVIASEAGLNRVCKTIRDDTLKCLKNYFKKCGTPLHREISDLIIDQVDFRINRFCGDKDKKSTFLTQSPCFHQKVFSTNEHKSDCNNKFLQRVNQIETSKVNVDEIHSTLCCGYNIWDNCTTTMVSDKCGSKGQQVFKSFLNDNFGVLTNMMCPLDLFPTDGSVCSKVKSRTGKGKAKLGDNAISKYILSLFSFLFVSEE